MTNTMIALQPGEWWESENESPQARLIAAAPDLLAALKSILASMGECDRNLFIFDSSGQLFGQLHPEQLRAAVAAVEKAEEKP